MIVSYNLNGVGDTLMLVMDHAKGQSVSSQRKDDVSCITREDGTVVGWNIFNASQHIEDLKGDGEIKLSGVQIEQLNQLVQAAGFDMVFTEDKSPKFVVGYVHESVKHKDSDHLTVNDIEVDGGERLQIVCGASNMRTGLRVVVAKVGAMMPSGLIIWPGELRGEKSDGMVCSAKELNLEIDSQTKGILELDETYEIGSVFELPSK